ncbi:MAG: AAA family ATPase [Saprospiraceae bacterium]|nr:AAA family ATPase [Saprospiraceae bacterium]
MKGIASELNIDQKMAELIFESVTSLIYKTREGENDVILKVLKENSPDSDSLLKFFNELDISKDLDSTFARRAIRKEKIGDKYALVLRYFDGETINEAFVKSKRPFEDVLTMAIKASDSLSYLHHQKIIHKDITKDNLMVSQDLSRVSFIDFGLSSKVDLKLNGLTNPDLIDGNLFYIAPEQAGRMNRKIDYRSDLYSFGIVLYEILTGKLPFQSEDSLELVHKHMTEVAPSPTQVVPEVPNMVSQIVMTLLNKNAEDRYQSSIALKKDLQQCLDLFRRFGKIDSFQLSAHEFTGQFRIPEKLYGRENEVKQILTAFDQIHTPTVEAIFVAGYSGVGKSALVNEAHIPITKRKGYFIRGKFDQFQKDVPYFALAEALKQFCRYLLTEEKSKTEFFKERILEFVGELGQIIVDVVPQLELILGAQPEVPELEPLENSIRFENTFQEFFKAICVPEHPLVLFLDDLQWADIGSLQLIKHLIIDPENPNFLLIGAYRDNEVDESHQLSILLKEARTRNAHLTEINLQPLSEENVRQMILETLHEESPEVEEFAQIVFRKTHGNAFFTIQLINGIFDEGLVEYDLKSNRWKINLEGIRQKKFSENVVEFMAGKLERLPAKSQKALQLASIIGNQFEISLLASLCDQTQKSTLEDLMPAIEEELIIPGEGDFKLISIDEWEPDKEFTFSFLHDRVQQAAYSLLEEDQRTKYHYTIAELLSSGETAEEDLFETVYQYNKALDLISDDQKRLNIADLNLKASGKAANASAYSSAGVFLEVANKLLTQEDWKSNYDLTRGVKSMAAEVFYINGDLKKSETYIQECLDHSTSDIDRGDAYFLRMLILSLTNLYGEAIDVGRTALKGLGFIFPDKEIEKHIAEHIGFLFQYFEKKPIPSTSSNPDMTGENNLAIIKLLDNFSMPTYVGGFTNEWILQALMKIKFSLEQGNTPETAYAFSELGLILNLQGYYDFALQAGQMSKVLAEKYEKRSLMHKARSFHLIANYNLVWHQHIDNIAEINDEGFRASMDSGELIFAGYTNFHPFFNKFYAGSVNLLEIKKDFDSAKKFNEGIHHDLALDALISLEMCINNLIGETKDLETFSNADFSESEFLEFCTNKKDFYGIATLHDYKSLVLYLNRQFDLALASIQSAYELVAPLMGSIVHFSTLKFIEALNYCQLVPGKGEDEKLELTNKIEAIISQFENWAKAGPANMDHKLFLLKGELNRIKGDDAEAEKQYLASIASAREQRFFQNEAIAHELIGRFLYERGKTIYANAHLKKAAIGFYQWGALSKSAALRKEFPEAFSDSGAFAPQSGSFSKEGTMYMNSGTMYVTTRSQSNYSNSFDAKALIQASQIIAEQIRPQDLLAKLMDIIVKNAGADKCAIVVLEDDQWWQKGLYSHKAQTENFEKVNLLESDQLPSKLLSLCSRTGEEFILQGSSSDPFLTKDEYYQKHNPKSIAVLPITLKSNLNALLYLENSVTADAFSSDKLNLIRMLSGQIAISLENSRLYENMHALNQAYQRFVPYKFLEALDHDSILNVKLGDHRQQQMTIVFSDIRGYTSLSEGMTPGENFDFINSYLNIVGPIVEKNDGFVNQFIGDGILSLFLSASDALDAAIESQAGVARFNQKRIQENKPPIKVGFGVHTGDMILGIIGDEKRHDTGVISSEVNTASRIEGLTKVFGTSIILSEATLGSLNNPSDYDYRLLGKVQVKGQKGVIKVFEFFGGDGEEAVRVKSCCLEEFNKGLDAYFDKDFLLAAGHLKKVLEQNPEDLTAERYLKNAAQFIVTGVDSQWTGVEKFATK